MSKNPKDNPGFVTHGECSATMGPMQASLNRLEKAIIGDDLSSGMVKKVSDLAAKVDSVVQTRTQEKVERVNKEANKQRWKIVAVGSMFTLIGIIIKAVLDKL